MCIMWLKDIKYLVLILTDFIRKLLIVCIFLSNQDKCCNITSRSGNPLFDENAGKESDNSEIRVGTHVRKIDTFLSQCTTMYRDDVTLAGHSDIL